MSARRLPLICAPVIIAGLTLALAAVPASAADYSGTWAADLDSCKVAQDSPEAPLVVTSKGYDQHEAHCKFQDLKSSGPGEWSGTANCSVEGDNQTVAVGLTVSGNTLTLTEDGTGRDLLRCP